MYGSLTTLSAKLTAMCLFILVSMNNYAIPFSSQQHTFLAEEDAFPFSYEIENNVLTLNWNTVSGHYLYKDKLLFEVISPSTVILGTPIYHGDIHVKEDPSFGMVKVYSDPLTVEIPIESSLNTDAHILVRYQGCAEAGLCYQPQKMDIYTPVQAPAGTAHSTKSNPKPPKEPAATPLDVDSALDVSAFLENANTLLIVAMMFVIGFGLAFTPCVLPMVPILMSIIVGAGENASKKRTLSLAFSYVQGMAITYTIAGVAVGLTGSAIQTSLQTPSVLYTFAVLLVLLSLSMFGFYDLQIPAFLRDRLTSANQKASGGTIVGAGAMGILAALLASPCVTAPLIGVLLYISTHGDPLLGGLALYSLALGIGAPQLGVAALGAHILPKPGGWMNRIKAIFGALLIGIALYLVKHLLPPAILYILGGSLITIISLLIGAFDRIEDDPKHWLRKGLGLSLLVIGVALIAKPILSTPQTHTSIANETFTINAVVRSLDELNSVLKNAAHKQRPALVDFYADWCTACIEMEHRTFNNSAVSKRLETYEFIQVDLTNNPNTDELLQRFELFGPPAYLWFDKQGFEIKKARLMGFLDPTKFLTMMNRFDLP